VSLRVARDLRLMVGESATQPANIANFVEQLSDTATYTKQVGGTRTIPAVTNVQIDTVGMTTIRAVLIRTDATIRVRQGVALNYVVVSPPATGQKAVYYCEGTHAQLWIDNQHATDSANVEYQILGS